MNIGTRIYVGSERRIDFDVWYLRRALGAGATG